MKWNERNEIYFLSIFHCILQGENELTERLLKKLNGSGRIHMVPASFKETYVIRFTVTSQFSTEEDIKRDFKIIQEKAKSILNEAVLPVTDEVEEEKQEIEVPETKRPISARGEIRKEALRNRRDEFGLSLMLSNVPMSPKFVNGSFLALFDLQQETVAEYAKLFRRRPSTTAGLKNRHLLAWTPRNMRLQDGNKKFSSFDSVLPIEKAVKPLRHRNDSLDSKIEKIFESFDSSSDLTADEPDLESNGHVTRCDRCGHLVANCNKSAECRIDGDV